jgi:hypothetical protein
MPRVVMSSGAPLRVALLDGQAMPAAGWSVEHAADALADVERRRFDLARSFGIAEDVLDAYGRFVADLPPPPGWTHFVTLTHDPRRLGVGHTIVGRQRHRRVMHDWLYDDVRRFDPSAIWYSELELHKSGQAHEHGLLSVATSAPVLSMRQAWFDRAGYAIVRPIGGADTVRAYAEACYVAKYAGKWSAVEPFIVGLGLHRRASHSLTLGGVR